MFHPLLMLSLLVPLAGPARGDLNSLNLDAPQAEAPEGDGLDAWTFDVEVVNGCYALVTGTVTDSGGGNSQAALTTYDDGVLIDYLEFSFPADGTAHPYCWVYQQIGEPGGGSVAIALRDTFDDQNAYDFLNFDISGVCTGPAPRCAATTWVDVPAVGPAGLGLLALVLAGAATFFVRRRLRA
jgi:hypothetical protein